MIGGIRVITIADHQSAYGQRAIGTQCVWSNSEENFRLAGYRIRQCNGVYTTIATIVQGDAVQTGAHKTYGRVLGCNGCAVYKCPIGYNRGAVVGEQGNIPRIRGAIARNNRRRRIGQVDTIWITQKISRHLKRSIRLWYYTDDFFKRV